MNLIKIWYKKKDTNNNKLEYLAHKITTRATQKHPDLQEKTTLAAEVQKHLKNQKHKRWERCTWGRKNLHENA